MKRTRGLFSRPMLFAFLIPVCLSFAMIALAPGQTHARTAPVTPSLGDPTGSEDAPGPAPTKGSGAMTSAAMQQNFATTKPLGPSHPKAVKITMWRMGWRFITALNWTTFLL